MKSKFYNFKIKFDSLVSGYKKMNNNQKIEL
jgi:hypothetical protein